MRHHPIGGPNRLQIRARDPAFGEVVLADDLEPVHRRSLAENLSDVRRAEADADAQGGNRETTAVAHSVRVDESMGVTNAKTPGCRRGSLALLRRLSTWAQ